MKIITRSERQWKNGYLIVQELKARIEGLDKYSSNPLANQVKEDYKDLLEWITDNQVEYN